MNRVLQQALLTVCADEVKMRSSAEGVVYKMGEEGASYALANFGWLPRERLDQLNGQTSPGFNDAFKAEEFLSEGLGSQLTMNVLIEGNQLPNRERLQGLIECETLDSRLLKVKLRAYSDRKKRRYDVREAQEVLDVLYATSGSLKDRTEEVLRQKSLNVLGELILEMMSKIRFEVQTPHSFGYAGKPPSGTVVH